MLYERLDIALLLFISIKVPTGEPTLYEFAPHGSHKADDDFSVVLKESEARIRLVYNFDNGTVPTSA
jgi:hypothetical protein